MSDVRTSIGLKEGVTAGSSSENFRIAVTTELGIVNMWQAIANDLGPGVRVYVIELPNGSAIALEHSAVAGQFEFICPKFLVT